MGFSANGSTGQDFSTQDFSGLDPLVGWGGVMKAGGAPLSSAFFRRLARARSPRPEPDWVTRSPISRIPPPNTQCISILEPES